jgi:Ca2+-binding RTX toxin-like protein
VDDSSQDGRFRPTSGWGQPSGRRRPPWKRGLSQAAAVLLLLGGFPAAAVPAHAAPAAVALKLTPADLAYILQQIKIAEAHVRNTNSGTGPCGALLGSGPDRVGGPSAPAGLRTIDGSCNNLQQGRESYAQANQAFLRRTEPDYRAAEDGAPVGASGRTTYDGGGSVVDSTPRIISNLVADQTPANPAAAAAARLPAGADGEAGTSLPIPNNASDTGAAPYNALLPLFAEFFDHGVNQAGVSDNVVFMPLQNDDPLVSGADGRTGTADDLPVGRRFMTLQRVERTGEGEARNLSGPLADLSQTYSSDPSHHAFLREYAANSEGRPVATGRLLSSANAGLGTWFQVKNQAASRLGLRLADHDVLAVPLLAVDPYGNFLPGPARGLPQFVTASGLVEGNLDQPVPVPGDAVRSNAAFLEAIAPNAVPQNPGMQPDPDDSAGAPGAPGTTYDDELLNAHFVAGDGRVNVHIGLTMMHQVFHTEHNRLVAEIKNILSADASASGSAVLDEWKLEDGAEGWNGRRLLQAARFITETEYQRIVFGEFVPTIQPGLQPSAGYQDGTRPGIQTEFANAVSRFGSSMLTDTLARTRSDGTAINIPLADALLNPAAFTGGDPSGTLMPRQAAGALASGMTEQTGGDIDEFIAETLRNKLPGLPLDLAALNIARARDTGIGALNAVRRQIHGATGDTSLKPYTNWTDFGLNLKNPASLVNFVAAYGQHPSLLNAATVADKRAAAKLLADPATGTAPGLVPADAAAFMGSTEEWANEGAASRTGLDEVDLLTGGLAEKSAPSGGLLGSTFKHLFDRQLTDLQAGDRFHYLARTRGLDFGAELQRSSLAGLLARNTDAPNLRADAFATADCSFELARLVFDGTTVRDDPASECNEQALLVRMPDGTVRYRTNNDVDPAGTNGRNVFNGTAQPDRIRGGINHDTILGRGGSDVIDGSDGADTALGGDGADILTDSAGDDILKGGTGNDSLSAGPGVDLLMGGEGADFSSGGPDSNETHGGAGNDVILAGTAAGTAAGDSGNDWIQGGDGGDILVGDSTGALSRAAVPGHDVLAGRNGDDQYDAGGGDDVMAAGAGADKNAGGPGYDWSAQLDPAAVNADLSVPLSGGADGAQGLDGFAGTEALSGAGQNDTLRGDDGTPGTGLDPEGATRIQGLAEILPQDATAAGSTWSGGNILLGGGGSDILEGRGGDDILDGDKYLRVRLSVRTNGADPGTEIGSTDSPDKPYLPGSSTTLQEAVFAGTVDPGNIVTVREIADGGGEGQEDTAVFSDVRANYSVTTLPAGTLIGAPGSVTTVTHAGSGSGNGGPGAGDGTDTLRNIEKLVFAD